jgi:hypothetical protein
LRRGQRANIKIRLQVLTVEDSLRLAAGFFNLSAPHPDYQPRIR